MPVPIPEARWPTAAEAARSRLFSPGRIGPAATASRTWIPAMVPWRASDDGFVTDDVVGWYGRFAEGRPGVLVVEATGIRDVPSGPLLRAGGDRFVPGLARIADEVRRRSGGRTVLLLQIIDFLAIKRRPDRDVHLRRFQRIDGGLRARLAAAAADPAWESAPDESVREELVRRSDGELASILPPRDLESMRMGWRERVTDVGSDHIRDLPRTLPPLFAAAARRAEQAGFHGVELHFAHAYTMASFLSATNTRSDGYGTTLEGRARLPLEVLAAVRAAVSPQSVVGCRMLADEAIPGGSTLSDAAWFATEFARAGIDFLSLSKGGKFDDAKQPAVGQAAYPYTGPSGHECMPTVRIDARGPFARNLPLASAVRAAVRAAGFGTPVAAAGGFNSFELAEAALRGGHADFVAAARQSLADPDWWEKMRTGRGAAVRRCLFTNYCEALDQRHLQVTCRLWDRLSVDGEGVADRSADGRRRLLPPRWVPAGDVPPPV